MEQLNFTRNGDGSFGYRGKSHRYRIHTDPHGGPLNIVITIYRGNPESLHVRDVCGAKIIAVRIATAFENLGDDYDPELHNGRSRFTVAIKRASKRIEGPSS